MRAKNKILEIMDLFVIPRKGLVLTPDLPVPNPPFKPFTAPVIIERPNGTILACQATFEITHFRMNDGSSKLSFSVILVNVSKDDVPKRSQVFVDESVAKILGAEPRQ